MNMTLKDSERLTPPQSVLVVDDSRVQRSATVKLCHGLGIQRTFEAANGQEALALLTDPSATFELVILDLHMPTMDGPELLEEMPRRHIDLPVIVCSSQERMVIHSVQDMGSVLGLNIVAALQKPLLQETLQAALARLHVRPASRKLQVPLPIDAGALREALEDGQIHVHFQPKASIRGGIVHGVEALARWRHPQLGDVPPDQFIPLAEHSDLIHPLTMEVMNQAMLQTAAWHARGLHLSVAINLSPYLLERSDLTREIASLQRTHGLPPECITLEVTETSLVSRLAVALGVLARLRLRGFGLSIDDYGTGFASMQQLARMPFTELKIDRMFVHGAHSQHNVQVILRSALDMANQLGLMTVAEGVETMQDWRLLQEFGCKLGQGWLIAKPMPGDELIAWLKQHRSRRAELSAPDVDTANSQSVAKLATNPGD